MTEERITFLSKGLKLEGAIHYESIKEGDKVPGIVLCHPHPLYGGDMDNLIIYEGARYLAQKGFISLRFNFRGTGDSEGFHDNGTGEIEDVKGAINYLLVIKGIDHEKIYLVGYSFGAWVAAEAAAIDSRVKAYAGIAPPISIVSFTGLKNFYNPKLLIAGDRDEICPENGLKELFSEIPQPKSLIIIPSDHFFSETAGKVLEGLGEFLQSL